MGKQKTLRWNAPEKVDTFIWREGVMKYKAKRYFSDDFKREAVQASLSTTQTQSALAGKLGIHPKLLSRWRREWIVTKKPSAKSVQNTGPDKSLKDLEGEISRLKKQLKRAELENEILKKADEYFAKHGK